MSYLDDFRKANNSTPTTNTSVNVDTGGYLDNFKAKNPKLTTLEGRRSTARLASAEQGKIAAEAESKRLNSLSGFAKTFAKDLFIDTPKEIVKETVGGTVDAVKKFPHSFAEDVKAGAEDIEQGKLLKGIVKSGFRVAGDTAITLFSPISSAIGAVLNATGGQKLIDEAGEVIADKSGITDMKKFQDFAMSHPNAAEDFDRLLFLGLIGKGGLDKKAKDPKAKEGDVDLRTKEQKEKETTLGSSKSVSPERMALEARTLVEKLRQPKQTERKLEVDSTTPEGRNVPLKTPQTVYNDYLKAQGYEPIVPDAKLPVIDAGKGGGSKLPVIEAGDTTQAPVPTGARLVPEGTKQQVAEVKTQAPIETAPKAERVQTETEVKQRVETPEEIRRNTEVYEKEVAENPDLFTSTTEPVQRSIFNTIPVEDYARLLVDSKDLPQGMVPTFFHGAVEAFTKTIRDINKRLPIEKALDESRIRTAQTSKAGQMLRFANKRVSDSLGEVPGISQLLASYRNARLEKQSARKGVGQDKILELTKTELREGLEKMTIKKAVLKDFIRTIKCN